MRQSEIDVLEIDRQMRQSVHETGKRPRDEYSEAMNYIVKKYRASSDQQEVVVQFPSFNEVRCQLSRHRTAQHIPVTDSLTFQMNCV